MRENPRWKDKSDITYEQYFKSHPLSPPEGFIMLLRTIEEELGKEKAQEILLKSRQRFIEHSVRRRLGNRKFESLRDYIEYMRAHRLPIYQSALISEVEEASDERYAYKIHSCLWAKTWGELGAQDIGYLVNCHSDYLSIDATNACTGAKLKLTRKSTLMQGAPYCDFCLTWTE